MHTEAPELRCKFDFLLFDMKNVKMNLLYAEVVTLLCSVVSRSLLLQVTSNMYKAMEVLATLFDAFIITGLLIHQDFLIWQGSGDPSCG
jgi:hypothetical protein